MTRLIFLVLCFTHSAYALEFASQQQATTVVELYTSEGCSSCPPADEWLSELKHQRNVFNGVLPLAFHVDYWDKLGWKDPFAQAEFSQRQRELVQQGLLSQVYTPGIVVNGQEWRAWFKGDRHLPSNAKNVGKLTAELNEQVLTVAFASPQALRLNVAYLGMGLESKVTAGENNQRTLYHDFVVLSLWQQQGKQSWRMSLPAIPDKGQQQTVLAVWISELDSHQIRQAAAVLLAE